MVEEKGSYGLLRGWQHRRHNEVTLSSLPRLDGKVALITGANSGIGKVATQFLARRGAKVFMACRSKTKAEEAITEIHRDVPDADLEFLPYDASSLSAVHSEALSFLDRNIPLDILLLNAGAIVENPQPSKDGLEWMFAINHLAHFMLAITLLPALEKAALQSGGGDVRAVCTTSAGFTMHPDKDSLHISDEDLNIEDPEQWWWEGTMPMYGRSKTCNILFATELNRRLRAKTTWGKKMRSNAIHPGTVSTGLNLQVRSRLTKFLERVVYSLVAIPTDVGSLNMLYAATSCEVRDQDISGQYLTPYGFVNNAPEGKPASNPVLADQLWQRSIQLCLKHVSAFQAPDL